MGFTAILKPVSKQKITLMRLKKYARCGIFSMGRSKKLVLSALEAALAFGKIKAIVWYCPSLAPSLDDGHCLRWEYGGSP